MIKRNDRMDILSRETMPMEKLNRFALLDGSIILDKQHNLGGRGVYVRKGKDNLLAAQKKNLLSKAFKTKISLEQIITLIEREGGDL